MIDSAVVDNGWVSAVYDFGNMFVHLTNAHDYAEAEADSFQAYEHRDEVIEYLNGYHGGRVDSPPPLEADSTLHDIAACGPHVLGKITSNLNSYIKRLRAAVGENG